MHNTDECEFGSYDCEDLIQERVKSGKFQHFKSQISCMAKTFDFPSGKIKLQMLSIYQKLLIQQK